jgi:hypothetical protein
VQIAAQLRDAPTLQPRRLPMCELLRRQAWRARLSLGVPSMWPWTSQFHSPVAPARPQASADRRLSGKVDVDLLPAVVRNFAQRLAPRLSSHSAMTPPAWPRRAASPLRPPAPA